MKISMEFLNNKKACREGVYFYNSIGNPTYLTDEIIDSIIISRDFDVLRYLCWFISKKLTPEQNVLWARNSERMADAAASAAASAAAYAAAYAASDAASYAVSDATDYAAADATDYAAADAAAYAADAAAYAADAAKEKYFKAIKDILYFGINMARQNDLI